MARPRMRSYVVVKGGVSGECKHGRPHPIAAVGGSGGPVGVTVVA
jgi:hypothetical protein